jgi:ADP-ribosylglycohydrolase
MAKTINSALSSYLSLQLAYPANKRLGGLIGLVAGDAIGVPFEHYQPWLLPARELIDIVPPPGFIRAYRGVPDGTYSDDSAQMLCLLASIQKHGKVDLADFSKRLCNWLIHGYLAVDNIVFDAGIQSIRSIHSLTRGIDPLSSGGTIESSNGNGSLMRVLPLALLHTGDDLSLVKEAHLQSMPTHAHPRSLVVCAFYCLVARAYLNESETPWESAAAQLVAIYSDWNIESERSTFLNELNHVMTSPLRDKPCGTGYVVDTIWTVRKAMLENSYEEVIKTCVRFGFDTDSSACVAGGLAGIKFGLAGIPATWLAQLRGWDIVQPHVEHLYCLS